MPKALRLSHKGGTGWSACHHSLNDLVWRALGKVNIHSVKKPSGLPRFDGKRPDCLELTPRKMAQMRDVGRHRHWHVGAVIPVIHIDHIWRCSGGRGRQEDVEILAAVTDLHLRAIAMETLGPMNEAGFQFLSELGRRISQEIRIRWPLWERTPLFLSDCHWQFNVLMQSLSKEHLPPTHPLKMTFSHFSNLFLVF